MTALSQGRRHLIHIAAQDGGQVGIQYRRIPPADEFHHRADFVGDGDLGKAHLAGNCRQVLFMGGIAIAVEQDNGAGSNAVVIGGLQCLGDPRQFRRL